MRRRKRTKKKKKTNQQTVNRIFMCRITNKNNEVLDVIPSNNYDMLLVEGMERAKEERGYWEIIDAFGRHIDGNSKR